MMDDNGKTNDDAMEKELAKELVDELDGVPEQFLDQGDGADGEQLAALQAELEEAKQQVLYARAETQNVRRRLEKDIADAKAYAATGFARDVLSVADNLARALAAVPQELREHSQMEGLVAGIEATQRELEKVFGQHGISRIASVGLPLDPNQHQAMIELPSAEHEPGTVISEMQSGYTIKDRLLRPALVAVAKKPD
jgi:molecular chaperone GrpE